MLIRVNMEDLREKTHSRHYELYRRSKLSEMGFVNDTNAGKDFRWGKIAHVFRSNFDSFWTLFLRLIVFVSLSLFIKLSPLGDNEGAIAVLCGSYALYFLTLNVKQESCKYQLVNGLTFPEIEPESVPRKAQAGFTTLSYIICAVNN